MIGVDEIFGTITRPVVRTETERLACGCERVFSYDARGNGTVEFLWNESTHPRKP